MSQDISDMSRRTVLKGVGALGVVGSATAGIGFFTQGAAASAETNIENPDKATTDDGQIKWVAVQSTGGLEWDGFDKPAQYARILTFVEMSRNGETVWTGQINDTGMIDLTQDDWGAEGELIELDGDYEDGQEGRILSDVDWGIIQRNRENIYNDGYGLPQNPAPADRLYVEEDGATEHTNVKLVTEYRLYDADQNELTGTDDYPDRPEAVGSFKTAIGNEASSTSFSGEDGQGEDGDSASIGT